MINCKQIVILCFILIQENYRNGLFGGQMNLSQCQMDLFLPKGNHGMSFYVKLISYITSACHCSLQILVFIILPCNNKLHDTHFIILMRSSKIFCSEPNISFMVLLTCNKKKTICLLFWHTL